MTTDDRAAREYARKLFAQDEPDQDPAEPVRRNHVPREGSNPQPPGDDPAREYARELFDRAIYVDL